MLFTYYATIINDSGEDWDQSSIVLSTASPGITHPPNPLPTSMVFFGSEAPDTSMYSGSKRSAPQRQNTLLLIDTDEIENNEPAPFFAEDAVTGAVFKLTRQITVKSSKYPAKVIIARFHLDTILTYSITPRSSSTAYLKAISLNSSPFMLLAGPAQVFVDGAFLSRTQLNMTVAPNEDFSLVLGPDQEIKVTYIKPLLTKGQSGVFQKTTIDTYKGTITLKNPKSVEVNVVVTEQLPLSSDERIKVSLVSPPVLESANNVTLNSSHNLEWKALIPPHHSAHLEICYTIEYPASTKVFIA